jgi:hypothetical protein
MVVKFLFTFLLSTCFIYINAQTIASRRYKASVSYICKKMEGGGCVIRTYCIVAFQKDSAIVSHITIVGCSPKERAAKRNCTDSTQKTYSWSMHDKIIDIHGLDEYGQFVMKEKELIVSRKVNNTIENIVFNQETD